MRYRNFSILLIIAAASLLPLSSTVAAPQAVITVNTLADDLTINGNCTLREALRAAALNTPWDGCAAGSPTGSDLIVFSVNGVINLALGQYDIASAVTFRGNGRNQTVIDAGGNSRIIHVEEASISLEALTLQNGNVLLSGGAIFASYSISSLDELILDNVVIQDSKTVSGGGALYSGRGKLTIKNSLLQRNRADDGGAISASNNNVTIEDSILQENIAEDSFGGGAIRGFDSDFQITRTIIQGNSSTNSYHGGGGLYIKNGDLTIIDSVIRNNIADFSSNGGGLALENGNLHIQGSTFSGNNAEYGSGGGIYFDSSNMTDPEFIMINSTISGNTALVGGGLFLDIQEAGGFAAIRHTTIANNVALAILGAGGAIFLDPNSQPVTLTRSIIHGNIGSPTCYPTGDLVSGGFNLLQDSSCGSHASDQVGANPLLGPLAYHGGAAQTHALLQNSPAIDAAPCLATINTDQRSAARPYGASCDSGAFEFGSSLPALYLPLLLR